MTSPISSPPPLANYIRLVERIDAWCASVTERFRDKIACRAGCDDCCRHLRIFPVEAVSLNRALHRLSTSEIRTLRAAARNADTEGPCPLLVRNRCRLYAARPIICRTHGMPIRIPGDPTRVDWCPKNWTGLTELPADAVLDLATVNTILVAVNRLFVEVVRPRLSGDRIPVAEALDMPFVEEFIG